MSVGSKIGLLEAIAWIGSRDWDWVAEVRRLRLADIELETGSTHGLVAWFWLDQALRDEGMPCIEMARAQLWGHCQSNRITAVGKCEAKPGYQEISGLDWLGAKAAERYDGIELPSSTCLTAIWREILFDRSDIEALWPGPSAVPSSLPSPRVRKESDGVKELRRFLNHASEIDILAVDAPNYHTAGQLFDAHIRWCAKRKTTPLKKSYFHEKLKAYRDGRWR